MVMEGSKTSVDSPSDTIDAQSKESVSIPTFVKPKTPPTKSGTSLQDPSRTWNRESDQLADELAALAMEMDPDAQPDSPVREAPSSSVAGPDIQPARPNPIEEEYIYETYIRISEENHSSNTMDPNVSVSNVGVLVIDEEDEDLWEGYMQSDDESDWDDEDSNGEHSIRSKTGIPKLTSTQPKTTLPMTIQMKNCLQTTSSAAIPTGTIRVISAMTTTTVTIPPTTSRPISCIQVASKCSALQQVQSSYHGPAPSYKMYRFKDEILSCPAPA